MMQFAAPTRRTIMFRIGIASLALALFASVAAAQPRQLPLSPGVMPGSPYGPGMPFTPLNPGPLNGQQPNNTGFLPIVPAAFGFYGPAYGYGYPFNLPFGFPYGNPAPNYIPSGPPPVSLAQLSQQQRSQSTLGLTEIVASKDAPATLTVQLPVAGEVWLDGKKVSSEKNEEQVLISPLLKQGEQYKFNVKAQWTHKGKTYETTRAVTLGSGDRSRILLVSGEEVSK